MKKIENNQGVIYKVINTETNEIYIGATKNSIDERKNDHIHKSNNGNGYKFHNAISTYGADSFQWIQIDSATSNNELASKEIKYISEYDTLENGYNSDKGGGFKKIIYRYNLNGSLNSTFEDLTAASNTINVRKQDISRACWSVNHALGGYLWSYEFKEKFIPYSDNRKKEVVQYCVDGKLLARYISASEASRKTGVSKTCITRCCRGEREQSRGFLWRYS